MANHIKVNFPADRENYESGNGEGMWVIVDDDTKAAHDSDATGEGYSGTLDNDSLYWPGLEHGARVPFEMRGDKRPVCPIDWLEEHYGAEDRAEIDEMVKTALILFDVLNRALFGGELKKPGFIIDDMGEEEDGMEVSRFFVLPYTMGDHQPFVTINTRAINEMVGKQEESVSCALAVTLLHQMTNYHCLLNGIEGYDGERYTEQFRDAARAHGLECEWNDVNGWGKTEIGGSGWESIARVLDDETAVTLGWDDI